MGVTGHHKLWLHLMHANAIHPYCCLVDADTWPLASPQLMLGWLPTLATAQAVCLAELDHGGHQLLASLAVPEWHTLLTHTWHWK